MDDSVKVAGLVPNATKKIKRHTLRYDKTER